MESRTDDPRERDQSGLYDAPDSYRELGEVSAKPPVQDETDSFREQTRRRRDGEIRHGEPVLPPAGGREQKWEQLEEQGTKEVEVSRLATQVYTHSYLVLFAILGTLARLGLTALTRYPGTPVIFNTVWSNFAGSLMMGFLAEDRMLFRHEWGIPTYDQAIQSAKQKHRDEEGGSGSVPLMDLTAAKKAHLATKKSIPLYIGLATGFCGSFTTFSSFIKDVFLALSNEMVTPGVADSPANRNGGYSFMAMLAVLITTVSLSLSGLVIGAHLAIALERVTPSIPFPIARKALDPSAVLLGWGCWIGAVLLCIFPPKNSWRGQATFALVFAPLGCLARFHLSLHLNGRVATFPMGTFAANVLGTVILGMAWDIAHVPIGGVVGCQVLQGVEDGFCGCLTTISTWVSELNSLRRRSAWVYGTASVVVSLVLMIAIMGGLRWSDGYSKLLCSV
ncbi:hypothetical protein QQZ08_011467 [Neonectria magnoliae]|uniref:Fluoride export protein 1 n=1 Tax=Neonectria magnoliae TaxID=2732573 RepID=A0ABR1HBF5_9HYPO